jgi:DNA polymerase/3'-5' exonuclease PolX/predicted flap endonuclease-1-like 5' DNA nuclease
MKQLFESAISNIEELLLVRTRHIELLTLVDKSKDATAIQFKIKYYKIWINLLRTCINKCVEIKTKEDIQALKLTKSLEHNLTELFETGTMKDLDNARNEVAEIEKNTNQSISLSTSINLFNSVNSHTSVASEGEEEQKQETFNSENNTKTKSKYNISKENSSKEKPPSKAKSIKAAKIVKEFETCVIDTSKIEAQPKILSDEIRPSDPHGAAIFDLRYVYGIGPKNAEKLVNEGVTLEGLLEDWNAWIKNNPANAIIMISKMSIPPGYTRNQWHCVPEDRQRTIQMAGLTRRLETETRLLGKLNSHQLQGVKYFHDMSQKIPREEVQRGERILKAAATHMNSELQITLCGSYRRGRPKSGDIDCLITHPGISSMDELNNYPVNILAKFVELLTNLGFLIDHLTDFGRSKYMGFCIINQSINSFTTKKTPTARRIDIRFIPYNSYGAAILYFTGSKTFNTQMRSWAIGKGYSLNEYGLKKVKDDTMISCKTEEEVFRILDYQYKTPEQRDI